MCLRRESRGGQKGEGHGEHQGQGQEFLLHGRFLLFIRGYGPCPPDPVARVGHVVPLYQRGREMQGAERKFWNKFGVKPIYVTIVFQITRTI